MRSLKVASALALLLASCLSTATASAQWPGLASKNNPGQVDPEQEAEPEVERLGAAPDSPTYSALSRQLVIPFAGFRYAYYSEALNAHPHVERVRYTDVYVHALIHAFNKPSVQGYYPSGAEAHGNAVGVRVGADLPFSPFCLGSLAGFGCAQPSLSLGYAPFPAFLTGSVTIRIPIY